MEVLGWLSSLLLLFAAGARAEVTCAAHSAADWPVHCRPTRRDCIRGYRADLEYCFQSSAVRRKYWSYLHTPGESCNPWNVTVDPEHIYTPSFRPVNVSLYMDVRSEYFFVYATWSYHEDSNLHNYEVRIKQKQTRDDRFDNRNTYCVALSRNTTQFLSPRQFLTHGRVILVQIITSPYDLDTLDCNMYSSLFYVPLDFVGNLTSQQSCSEQVNDHVQSVNIERSTINTATSTALLMEVTLSWEAPSLSQMVYFISLTDPLVSPHTDCRSPGDNPPCFATNSTSVTVGPLNASRKYFVNIDAYSVCDGYGIMAVYSGCHDCCHTLEIAALVTTPVFRSNAVEYTLSRNHVQPSTTTREHLVSETPSFSLSPLNIHGSRTNHLSEGRSKLIASQSSPLNSQIHSSAVLTRTLRRTEINGIYSFSMSPLNHQDSSEGHSKLLAMTTVATPQPLPSSSVLRRTDMEPPLKSEVGPITTASLIGYVTGGVALFVVVMTLSFLAVIGIRKRGKMGEVCERVTTITDEQCFGSPVADGTGVCATHSVVNDIVEQNGEENITVLTLEGDREESISIETSHNSLSSLRSPSHSSVLVIYSPRCPDEEKEVILQLLMSDLQNYEGIYTTSHDLNPRECIPKWIEREVKSSTAVLCVCNEQFWEEWKQEVTVHCTVVYSLQQIMYALVSQCEDLSLKFAVVLMNENDHKFIPTQYLQSVKRFFVTELREIAHFVKQVQLYERMTLDIGD